MKKGLISVLGTIILATAGSGYAEAPTIAGIPDVIIADDELAGTTDLNFFRAMEVFNIMDYVQDPDTTDPAQFSFAFDELNDGGVDNLLIGDATQLDDPAAAPTAWSDTIDTSAGTGSFLFSFRDILRSPLPADDGDPDPDLVTGANAFDDPLDAAGDPVDSATEEILPWSTGASTLDGESREVEIFVADEANNVDSDTILVYSVNAGEDGLSGTFQAREEWGDDTFAAGDWLYLTAPPTYGVATSTGADASGLLGLTTTATTTASGDAIYARFQQNSPGFVSPIDFVEGDVIYGAKMRLGVDAAEGGLKAFAPDLRFGSENTLQILVQTNVILSTPFGSTTPPDSYNPQIPDVGSTMDYTMFWSPMADLPGMADLADVTGVDARRFRVFFDVVDVDQADPDFDDSGTWELTLLEVGTLMRPAASSPTTITDFSTGNGWSNGGSNNVTVTGTTSEVTFEVGAASASTDATFALWTKADVADWTAGTMIHAQVTLAAADETSRTNFGVARLRHQTVGGNVGQLLQITPNALSAGSQIPAVAGSVYETFVPAAGGPSADLIAASLDSWIVAIDAINVNQAAHEWAASNLILDVLDDPLVD